MANKYKINSPTLNCKLYLKHILRSKRPKSKSNGNSENEPFIVKLEIKVSFDDNEY